MIKALVLTGDGINCETETAFALEQAGASPTIMHINTLIESPRQLQDFQILALPGGFSFGDEVGSGKILSIKLRYGLEDLLYQYVSSDNLVIGICNGFQALVKLGLLPNSALKTQQVTLTHNRQQRFINRWVSLNTPGKSLFFEGLSCFMLPIRHGEGRLVVPQGQEDTFQAQLTPHIELSYEEDVNGAFLQIAGLINERGNILGLMPHPEACVTWTQHPAWTSMNDSEKAQTPAGLAIFRNMVKALRN